MNNNFKDELIEAEKRLILAKSEFFRQEIIHKAFEDTLALTKMKNVKSYTQRDEMLRAMEKKHSLVESLSYVEGNPDEERGSICGVTSDTIHQMISRINLNDKDISDQVLPLISRNVSKLASHASQIISNSSEIKTAQNLAAKVRESVRIYEETSRLNEEYKETRRQLLRDYLSILVDLFSHLEKIVSDFSLSIQMDLLDSRIETLKEKLKLLLEEVESLKLVLARNIYSQDNLRSLKNIALKLSLKEEDADVEINDTTSLLSSYLELGESFSRIAREYAKVKSDYEILKWAEEEFGSKS